ncbi:MAG: transcription-repair coupling factor [Elusimicrobia bacterium]|nr:transcription-repair coupling factor [Candidatus Obscuribacterium magneticum]
MNEISLIGGLTRGAFPWWFINQSLPAKSLIVVSEEDDVLGVVDDMRALFKLRDWGLPPPFEVAGYTLDDEPQRQVSLHGWLFGKVRTLVTSIQGLSLPCDDPEGLRKKTFPLKPGLTIKRGGFLDRLAEANYSRTERVEQVGEVAIRGDVTDIWPPEEPAPIRIVWNMDTIEALRPIDLYSQRSEGYRTDTVLHPVLAGSNQTLAGIIPKETDIVHFASIGDDRSLEEKWPEIRSRRVGPFRTEGENANFGDSPPVLGQIPVLKERLQKWQGEDWRVAVFCHNQGEWDRLEELLAEPSTRARGEREPWMPLFIIGELEHGFLDMDRHLAVLSNSEIFGRYRKRVRLPKFEGGAALASPFDIAPNDYLVHERHGIGRYLGLRSLKVRRVISEFLAIEYKGGDKLYVPIFDLQQVQRYLGAEGHRPSLSSLDTSTWERVKSRVREDVARLAADLLNQAAQRAVRPGHAFPARTHLEEEFAASFIFQLTPDQEKTLQDVEADMMSPKAMDRLICGDVGYGKTEVAMRAALKCALAGKQVTLLCPTTILAEQHYRNFTERLADYPVTVSLLSRFQTPAEQKKIVRNLSKGGVDVVIGTHRLLSADVQFKELGLVIVDEEHRFGVRQKQKLLAFRETVDVLSLTATPIPRTLASAMGGIKDLSVIETAPEGRLPILTHVGLFDEDVVARAVQEELDRGGQVFYVHNRVKTLLARKRWLEGLLPSVRIGVGHGQMREHELETTMHGFLRRKYDILLSTTIIESGLDIPSVNTLIVEEAEEFGLAQLYQLRGRVGRSRTRATCYLFHSSAGMTQEAKKRLQALREFTALGSGFRLALRDMEIRGAGNLLGPQQHGSVAAVGIETYGRLLNEEIQRLKGEAVAEEFKGPVLELALSAYIPDDYMPAESERIHTYKRILSADEDKLIKLKEEMIDRCGPLPEPVQTLLEAASLRLLAGRHEISEVHQDNEDIVIYFRSGHALPEATFQKIVSQPATVLSFIPGPPVGVRFVHQENETSLAALARFIRFATSN